jgi:SHS2 domain-containing protein
VDEPVDEPERAGAERAGAASAGNRTVPHTADMALEAWAPTKDECVAQAARALVGGFAELADATPRDRAVVGVTIDHASDDDLLVSVLDEVIYQAEVHGRVPVEISVCSSEGRAGVRFETVPIAEITIVGAVPKAVSLHELRFGPADGAWRCHVTVDV